MLKAATGDAARLLISTVNDPEAKLELRIRCAETILDRVYGRAAQPIEADGAVRVILEGLEEYAG